MAPPSLFRVCFRTAVVKLLSPVVSLHFSNHSSVILMRPQSYDHKRPVSSVEKVHRWSHSAGTWLGPLGRIHTGITSVLPVPIHACRSAALIGINLTLCLPDTALHSAWLREKLTKASPLHQHFYCGIRGGVLSCSSSPVPVSRPGPVSHRSLCPLQSVVSLCPHVGLSLLSPGAVRLFFSPPRVPISLNEVNSSCFLSVHSIRLSTNPEL